MFNGFMYDCMGCHCSFTEDFDDDEERVNFQSLYEAMATSSEHSVSRVSDSNRTVITDVTDSVSIPRVASYKLKWDYIDMYMNG